MLTISLHELKNLVATASGPFSVHYKGIILTIYFDDFGHPTSSLQQLQTQTQEQKAA